VYKRQVKEVSERTRAEEALARANEELKRLSMVDGLTQVANRRHMEDYLRQQWARLARERAPLTVVMCDVDFFKRFNDTYGHQAGDDCLRTVARGIEGALRRPADLVARYGGEEFLVILPDTTSDGALAVTEQIAESVARADIEHDASDVAPRVTLSMGVASAIASNDAQPARLIASADRALYAAKRAGRNRVVMTDPDAEPLP